MPARPSRPVVAFESFERRVLLAAAIDDVIAAAIARVSDLSQYSTGQLREAREWAVTIEPSANFGRIQHDLGAEKIRPTGLLDDVYLATFPTYRTGQSIARAMQTYNPGKVAWPLVGEEMAPRLVPNDPQFPQQWHLNNTGQSGGLAGADANVTGVWDNYLGDGVVIGVVDDGVAPTHPDLAPNYRADLSWDFVANDNNPSGGSHGVSVAGVAGAKGNNGVGVSGAAPNAQHAGLKLLGATSNDQKVADALSWMKDDIDIYNNSWGPSDGGSTVGGGGPLALAALANAAQTGRSGLGNIWTWAAGNGGNNDNVNYDSYANSRYTVSVAAITNLGVRSSYSEHGAPNLVAAYSNGGTAGITTTSGTSSYTSSFGGTSSASPLAAGVIALVLQANPSLSWRDVQHVLVNSAEKNDPTHPDWTLNGAGHDVNHYYGYGAVDAAAAVALAQNWANVPPEVSATTGTINVAQPIPNNNTTGLVQTVQVGDAIKLEAVEVVFNATHTRRGDLRIVLVSPSGTESVLTTERPDSGDWTPSLTWVFSTKRHWDEDARGTWTLKVIDDSGTDSGTLNSFKLNFYGTNAVSTPAVFGTVYDDANANGLRDPGEAGIAGVKVYVDSNNSGGFDDGEPTADTAGAGSYTIADLTLGEHTVRMIPPAGMRISQPSGGGHTVTLTEQQNFSTNNNFGLANPRAVGTVFDDADDDGVFDAGEPALEGVTVFIDANDNGNLDVEEDFTLSGTGGEYVLGGLDDGTHVVRAVTPAGRRLTLPGGNGSNSASISGSNLLVSGLDFGFTDRVRIGGVVYDDANGNGARDPGEAGLGGARVYQDLDNNAQFDDVGGTFVSANVPLPIPPSGSTGITTSTVAISGVNLVSNLTVTIENLTHSYDGDLVLTLISPSGTRVTLASRRGGNGDNYINTVFDDAAAASITAGTAPFTGSFRPEQALSTLNGEPANGTWTLEVHDMASGDSGTLNGWSVTLGFTEPNAFAEADGSYQFAGLAAGTHRVRQVPLPGQTLTEPASGVHILDVTGGQVVTNANFGNNSAVPLPAVSNSGFEFDGATLPAPPHTLSYTFNTNVSASLAAEDLLLENLTTGQPVPTANVLLLNYHAGTNTATFSFPGYTDGVLPDGNYRATLLAAGVTNAQNQPMAADVLTDFFVLAGDANHDGTVNLNDFNVMANNFGQSGRIFSQGDFNYDGTVDLADFNLLASRFGTSLGAAATSRTSPFASGGIDERQDRVEEEDDLLA